MPLYTDPIAARPYTADDIQYGTGDVVEAQAAETFLDSPLLSAIPRAAELDIARRRYGGAYQNFDRVGAEGWLAKRGLTLEDLPLEDRTYNELELSILSRRKVAEIRRNQVLGAASGGVGQTLARLGTALGVSVLDPINLASGFVPVFGEARYARILAAAGGPAGRAAARAGVGAVEGVVGATALEPLIAAARRQELADYGLADSLTNIAFGGLLGGGLHAVGGAVGDALRPAERLRQAAEPILARPEAAAVAPEPAQPVSVRAPVTPEARPDPYFDDAQALKRAMIAARDIDVNDPAALARMTGVEAKPLAQFIKETGGIFDNGGELAARDITNKSLPGLVRKEPGPMNAATIDAVRVRAWEAGYFPEAADYNEISPSDLLDALAEDVSGRRRYPASAEPALNKVRADREFIDRLESQGITRDMDAEAIAKRLRDLDEEARAQAIEDTGVSPDVLAEYDQTARFAADSATEAQRGEALKAAVAQAVGGEPIEVRPVFGEASAAEAAARLSDPDAHPLADPVAAERIDTAAAEAGPVDRAALEREVADLDAEIRAMREEAALGDEGDDAIKAALADSDEAIATMEESTRAMSQAARLLSVCATRSAA